MGGNVAVSIKNEDGNVLNMDRWTNVMPYFFSHYDLYCGDFKVWAEEFTKSWREMQADYEENKLTGKYKLNMTGVYFPFDTTSPSEYGLIVVDAQNKKIYSAQDYCQIGSIGFYKLEDDETREHVSKLYKAGAIKQVEVWEHKKDKESEFVHYPLSLSSEEFERNVDLLIANRVNRYSQAEDIPQGLTAPFNQPNFDPFSLSLNIESEWTFFVTSARGGRAENCLRLREEMQKDGWLFTDSDNVEWKQYIMGYFDYYDEDEKEGLMKLVSHYNQLMSNYPGYMITEDDIKRTQPHG